VPTAAAAAQSYNNLRELHAPADFFERTISVSRVLYARSVMAVVQGSRINDRGYGYTVAHVLHVIQT